MDISRHEQRVLHLLAQGGHILVEKDERGRIIDNSCVTRDGWYWRGCTPALFKKLKRRRYIASKGGGPYRITQLGLTRVRSQANNR
ncbi:YjhX family toxin [Hoeflea sp. TYP-13]|uniref:YjhX family toxin n=1 Tax=Hoeflea sp. TYP-13 TaxID=3230023 RepID=UPI0034C679B2